MLRHDTKQEAGLLTTACDETTNKVDDSEQDPVVVRATTFKVVEKTDRDRQRQNCWRLDESCYDTDGGNEQQENLGNPADPAIPPLVVDRKRAGLTGSGHSFVPY